MTLLFVNKILLIVSPALSTIVLDNRMSNPLNLSLRFLVPRTRVYELQSIHSLVTKEDRSCDNHMGGIPTNAIIHVTETNYQIQ